MNKQNANSRNFFELLIAWLKSLPTDIKILIEMIGDNELEMKARTLAVGTIVYILTPLDLIPEKIQPIIGYIDDVIILRIALAIILEMDSNRAKYYKEKYPETLEVLDQQIVLLRETLGALYSWLQALVEKFHKRKFNGNSAEDAASSEQTQEEMFDETMEYAANINVDVKTIEQALLKTPPNKIIGLLSSGLEQEEKRQEEAEKEALPKITAAMDGFRKMLGRGTN